MTTTKKSSSRNQKGTGLTEFAAALPLFFCGIFVPLIDVSFVPARYLLTMGNLDNVVHRMALSEKRTQALQYLHGNSWKAAVECWGVTVKDAKASLIVCDETGNTRVELPETSPVPKNMLPNGTKRPNGENATNLYSMEITTVVDVPPLFNGSSGLPGFTKPITFTFRNRTQWENLSPDPYTTTDVNSVQYYINE